MKTNSTSDSLATVTPIAIKFASLGTVSHGTLRDEDLLEAFASELDWQIRRNGEYFSRPENFSLRDRYNNIVSEAEDMLHIGQGDGRADSISEDQYEEASEMINETLIDALNTFAPPFCQFGAHPGDGSDFGYWPVWEEIDELPTVDGSDAARELGEECKSVNDHGNVTVYGGDGSILLELV